MWLIVGFGAQLTGVAALAFAQRGPSHRFLLAAGLLFLAISVGIFCTAYGSALGICWALSLVSIAAYLWFSRRVVSAREFGRARESSRRAPATAGRLNRLGLSLRLFSAGPLYLVASLGLGLLLATKLPWQEVNRLMLGGLLIPAFWAAGALHATADLRVWRTLVVPAGLIALSALVYFVL